MLYTHWCNEGTDLIKDCHTYEKAFNAQKYMRLPKKMTEYEPLSKVLEDIVQQIQERNICKDHNIHMSGEMSINECDDSTNAGEDGSFKFDMGPYVNSKEETYHTNIYNLKSVCLIQNTVNCLLPSIKNKVNFFTHIMNEVASKKQITCCLHGGAGTGKSHVLRAVYQGLYTVLCKAAGENTDNYKILLLAPTGKAAYNIGGATIQSALHIPAQQKLEYKGLSYNVKTHSEHVTLI